MVFATMKACRWYCVREMQTYNHVIVPAVGDNLRHFDCSICLCDLGNAGEWKEQFVQQLFVNVPLTAASLSTVPEGSGVGLSFLHFSCHVELCRDVASPPKSSLSPLSFFILLRISLSNWLLVYFILPKLYLYIPFTVDWNFKPLSLSAVFHKQPRLVASRFPNRT
jgi:hypothetical protein